MHVEAIEIKDRDIFTTLEDEEILAYVQKGDTYAAEFLVSKYERIVYKKANTYFLIGSDRDDVIQEGFIGLFKAMYDYDENKRSSFKSFAELCITRQIITSIKTATRLKHTPLNSYISIYKPVHEEESERMLLDTMIDNTASDPKDYLLQKEQVHVLKNELMKALTRLEWDVLAMYVQGFSYDEVALALNRSTKSIDNALQRVKRKICNLDILLI